MAWHTWLVYFVAALGLSPRRGRTGLLALTHGGVDGRCRAVFTVLGGSVGFTAVIAGSMFGIGALLASRSAHLAHGDEVLAAPTSCGWASRSGAHRRSASTCRPRGRPRRRVSALPPGFCSAVTNPGPVLRRLPARSSSTLRALLLQFAVMAGTFVGIEFVTEMLIAGLCTASAPGSSAWAGA